MGAAGFEDGKSHVALVSNRTGEGLATWNIPYYEIEYRAQWRWRHGDHEHALHPELCVCFG